MVDEAVRLHMEGRLTFFDSLYAATAMVLDATLVNSDTGFGNIPGLKYMPVSEYVSEVRWEYTLIPAGVRGQEMDASLDVNRKPFGVMPFRLRRAHSD